MQPEWTWWLNALGAVFAAAIAFVRNRNPIPWFFLAAAFPLFGLVLLVALEPLAPDGTAARCCHHCEHEKEAS